MAENYHLTYNKEAEEWHIKKEGGSRPSDQMKSHSKALKRARELAVNSNTNLIIHDEDGKILGSESAEDINKGIFTKIADKVEGAVGAVASAIKS